MSRPDYRSHGFVNLIASLVEARGGAPRHAALGALPAAELREARNVVFAIIDGLGDNYLRANGTGGALLRHRRGAISAVFPSTTATAITTSFTGATPLEHGLTGWFTYFSEAGCVGAPLPFQRRGERNPLGVHPGTLFVEAPLFDGLAARSIVVSWRKIIDSAYNVHHCGRAERLAYDDLAGFFEQTARAVESGPERKFVYAYWPEFDALSHQHGVGSAQTRAHFEALDAGFGALLDRLMGTDTVLVLSADHGFIDCPVEESIELPPELSSLLRFPLCGERRVAFCHVQDEGSFARQAGDFFGSRAQVRPSRELAGEGWFGGGRAHARFAERIGDVALLMTGRGTVKDWVAGEPRHLHIGNHGGTSDDEMHIPLVVAKNMKIRANGIEINYEVHGKEAPWLVLSHSLACSVRMWDPQIAALKDRYRILAYDTRGHGATEAPKGAYTLDQLADDLFHLLKSLKIDKAHYCGLSMGGMIGQTFALKYPGIFQSLTLADTTSRYPAEAAPVWADRVKTAEANGMEPLAQPTLERWFTEPFRKSQPAVVDGIRKLIVSTPVAGYAGCCHALPKINVTARLKEIRCPILVIVGEQDPGTPVTMAKEIHDNAPGSRLVMLPQAAHLANLEQPAAFTRALEEFLRAA